jgi:hypothetical protein
MTSSVASKAPSTIARKQPPPPPAIQRPGARVDQFDGKTRTTTKPATPPLSTQQTADSEPLLYARDVKTGANVVPFTVFIRDVGDTGRESLALIDQVLMQNGKSPRAGLPAALQDWKNDATGRVSSGHVKGTVWTVGVGFQNAVLKEHHAFPSQRVTQDHINEVRALVASGQWKPTESDDPARKQLNRLGNIMDAQRRLAGGEQNPALQTYIEKQSQNLIKYTQNTFNEKVFADALGAVNEAYATPTNQLIQAGETLLTDLKALKSSLDARGGTSFAMWRTRSLERGQAEIMIRRIPMVEAALVAAKSGNTEALRKLTTDSDLVWFGGPKELQNELDVNDKAGMAGIEWSTDVVKLFAPPPYKIALTVLLELVKHQRGEHKTLAAVGLAVAADAIPDLLGMDKLPGNGKAVVKAMVQKGGLAFAAQMAPALANVLAQLNEGTLTPSQALLTLQGDIAKAAGKTFVELGGGAAGAIAKQLPPVVREKVVERIVGFLKSVGEHAAVKPFMEDFAKAVAQQ